MTPSFGLLAVAVALLFDIDSHLKKILQLLEDERRERSSTSS
jgi:hypothetical protein